uniref:Alkaline ceramidase n=1 Tax=Phallusia mammillata TaxID=59560 RepID=A0A6F9D665_9ASCI|nr:alkaline ceramidase 3-like [Phallusia mammillata]
MAPRLDVSGIWGPVTSTLDWCEENYVVTPYIAEFWNTVSNVIMIFPPLVCAIYYWRKGVELRHVLTSLSLLAVGLGSWMFHMTLWYEMQLLDELPMIYGTCVFLYSLHHHDKPRKSRNLVYLVALCFCSVAVTVIYLMWKNPVFHQVCYALLVAALVYEAIVAFRNYPAIQPLVLMSVGFYAFGFFLWNVDNIFCSHLRKFRNKSHFDTGMVFQLHAWWHIFTGFATYLHVLFSCHARLLHLRTHCSIKRLGGFWPYLEIGKTP